MSYSAHHETVVEASPKEAHKQFVNYIWLGLTVPQIPLWKVSQLTPKTDDAGNGSSRWAGGMTEKVKKAKLGEYFIYNVVSGPVPFKNHEGIVRFHDAGPGHTRITWDATYDAKIPGGGAVCAASIAGMFPNYLRALRISLQSKSSRGPGYWLTLLIVCWAVFGMASRFMAIPTVSGSGSPEYLALLDSLRAQTSELDAYVQATSFLVIGGTGFTGSGIVDDLRKRGAKKVKVLGRNLPPALEYPYGFGNAAAYPLEGVEYVQGSTTSLADMKRAMEGVNVVFHTAASYGTPTFSSLMNGDHTEAVNFGGMKNVVEAAQTTASVNQVIYTSSCDTVFSGRDTLNANETHPYAQFGVFDQHYATGDFAVGDHYARTKIMAERYLLENDNKGGVRTMSLRPNGIYGPGETTNFPKATAPAYVLGLVPFYFDAEQESDWTCLYNLVYSHVLGSKKLAEKNTVNGGKAYFITDDENQNNGAFGVFAVSMDALAGRPSLKRWLHVPGGVLKYFGKLNESAHKWFKETLDVEIPMLLTYKETLKSLVTHTHDISAAKKELGYKPLITAGQCLAFQAEEMARRYKI